MKKLFVLSALPILLAGMPVLAETNAATTSTAQSSFKPDSNGGYKAKDKTEQTDVNGTTTTKEMTKEVEIDSDGNKETSVHIKDATDPKGLFNKTSTIIENNAKESSDKTEYTHKKIENGTTVEETNTIHQTPPKP